MSLFDSGLACFSNFAEVIATCVSSGHLHTGTGAKFSHEFHVQLAFYSACSPKINSEALCVCPKNENAQKVNRHHSLTWSWKQIMERNIHRLRDETESRVQCDVCLLSCVIFLHVLCQAFHVITQPCRLCSAWRKLANWEADVIPCVNIMNNKQSAAVFQIWWKCSMFVLEWWQTKGKEDPKKEVLQQNDGFPRVRSKLGFTDTSQIEPAYWNLQSANSRGWTATVWEIKLPYFSPCLSTRECPQGSRSFSSSTKRANFQQLVLSPNYLLTDSSTKKYILSTDAKWIRFCLKSAHCCTDT